MLETRLKMLILMFNQQRLQKFMKISQYMMKMILKETLETTQNMSIRGEIF